jgi:hypothetical protein
MKILLRIGICCTLGCMLAGGLMAQRGGGGHGGGGGFQGGGTGGFRGGGGISTGGFRGGYGGIGYGRGLSYGYGRTTYRGYGYGPAIYGWGGGLGYYSPYYGYWDDPYYSTYTSGYAPPVEYNPSPNVTVIYPAAPQAQQPVYDAPVRPMMRSYDQYGQEVDPSSAAGPSNSNGSPRYLIAMKDQTIRAAAAYWADGRTLHYITLQHEEKQAPLDSVDRGLSLQLNRERRVAFQLPQ